MEPSAMKVEELYLGPKFDCEAKVQDFTYQHRFGRWREQYGDRCQCKARYIVNGKKLCKRHAGVAALDHLLGVTLRAKNAELAKINSSRSRLRPR